MRPRRPTRIVECMIEHIRPLAVAFAAVVSLAGLSACGGNGEGSPSADPIAPAGDSSAGSGAPAAVDERDGDDGCVAADPIGAAVGVPLRLDDGSALTGKGLGFCHYRPIAADADPYIAVDITLHDANPVHPEEGDAVAGIGEQAVWTGLELAVWNGEVGVTVSLLDGQPADPLAAATTIAALFLGDPGMPDSPAAASTTAGPAATGDERAPGPGTDAAGTDGADVGECPSNADVSGVWGAPAALDTSSAMTGAVGLVFCPYEEVIAPGTTDQFGTEIVTGDFFSITLSDQQMIDPSMGGDQVTGLGQQATWDGSTLAVWTGERGLLVDVTFPPEGREGLELAIALAGVTLGVDTTGAEVVAGSNTEGLSTDATGCPESADIGDAVGLDLELGLGAGADLTDPSGPSAYCPYQLAAPGNPYDFGVVVSIADDLAPVDPALPTEDLTEYFGIPATWQDAYHVVLLEDPEYGKVVVQITSNELDLDDREAAIAIAEAVL